MSFRCDVRRLQDRPVAVVTLQGDVDSVAAHKLNEALGVLLDDGVSHVAVDMVRVGYVNSEGWRVLLLRARECDHANGALRLADMAPDLETVFNMLGLSEVIASHADLEDALQACVTAHAGGASRSGKE